MEAAAKFLYTRGAGNFQFRVRSAWLQTVKSHMAICHGMRKKAARYSRESEPVERVPKVARTTHYIGTVKLLLTESKAAANETQLFAGAASQQLTKTRYFFFYIYKNKLLSFHNSISDDTDNTLFIQDFKSKGKFVPMHATKSYGDNGDTLTLITMVHINPLAPELFFFNFSTPCI